jgi:hypothetical protein
VRMERDILKNSRHFLGATEMKFRFIEDHRDTWPVRLMCDALECKFARNNDPLRGGFRVQSCPPLSLCVSVPFFRP